MSKNQEENLNNEFSLAFNLYGNDMCYYAYSKVNNFDISVDLVQDTFIKTWHYLSKGGKIQKMKSFLYRVLKNLIVDQYRKHKQESLDTLLEEGFNLGFDDTPKVLNIIDGKQALGLINFLPAKCRKVMNMKYLEDLSLEEIAHKTGASKNSISVLLHRGIEKIKDIYSEQSPDMAMV